MSFCLCLCLCGCDFAAQIDELVSPPELTGQMYPIAEALKKSAGGDYDLKHPTSGDNRSAVVLEDVNQDGTFEAFAFYSTYDDEMTNMHINLIRQIDETWVSVYDQTIVATGVEMVDFCDLNGNGNMEILVGWEVNGKTQKQLSIFSFDDENLTQQLLQPYSSFLCCDLDDNGTNEVFVHLLDIAQQTNRAIVYNFGSDGVAQTAGCLMDSGVKTASAPVLAQMTNGQNAVYIDEIKGVDAITEVLYLSRGQLVNPLLDAEAAFQNIATSRAAALTTRDINDDGIPEIPVASPLPNAVTSEALYYTNWCSFNGEKLSTKLITVVNTVDGYLLKLPKSLIGKIAVSKDLDHHKREFYLYDAKEEKVDEPIFSICAVALDEWLDEDYHRGEMTELARNENWVFALKASKGAMSLKLTQQEIKEMFSTIEIK